jgi:HEPN domain-containing protein
MDGESKDRVRRPRVPRTAIMGQRFWLQSQRDLEAARRLVAPDMYYAALYFAHQSAEKALKAAHWHLRAEEPPWIHNLRQCAELVSEAAGGIPIGIQDGIDAVQPTYDQSRYPDGEADGPLPFNLVRESDASQGLRLAEEVSTWVEQLLQRPPGRPRRTNRS